MPGMDGTGPMGLGPMTGGGRGWCNPYFARAGFPSGVVNPYYAPYGGTSPYWYGTGYAPYPSYGNLPYSPYGRLPYAPFSRGRGMGRGAGRGMGRGWWW